MSIRRPFYRHKAVSYYLSVRSQANSYREVRVWMEGNVKIVITFGTTGPSGFRRKTKIQQTSSWKSILRKEAPLELLIENLKLLVGDKHEFEDLDICINYICGIFAGHELEAKNIGTNRSELEFWQYFAKKKTKSRHQFWGIPRCFTDLKKVKLPWNIQNRRVIFVFLENLSKKIILTPNKPQCVIQWNGSISAMPAQRHFWSLISGYWKKNSEKFKWPTNPNFEDCFFKDILKNVLIKAQYRYVKIWSPISTILRYFGLYSTYLPHGREVLRKKSKVGNSWIQKT